MKVSVIIVNYNTFALTCNCIESILTHTSATLKYEIILVDNGSHECDADAFLERFPQIRLIKSKINLGFSKGNNLGIQSAAGEFILLLNSDTILLNDAISLAIDVMERDKEVGVLSGQLLYPNGRPQPVAMRFNSLQRVLKELFRITNTYSPVKRKQYYLGEQWDYNQPTETDWVWGAFFLFKKIDLARFPNQKLHDNFFMYHEDVQWCYYFKKTLKRKIMYHPAPRAIHFVAASDNLSTEGFSRYRSKIFPNEYSWMVNVKGKVYAFCYYFTLGLFYMSLHNKKADDQSKGLFFLKTAFKNLRLTGAESACR